VENKVVGPGLPVVDGLSLSPRVPQLEPSYIEIPNVDGESIFLADKVLGGHVLLVGGIGQGKTNAIYHLLHAVRDNLPREDMAVIFDPKGDYLRHFWRPGDIVINDPRSEKDEKSWNLLAELETSQLGSHDKEETANEIAHTLFDDDIEGNPQPFFPLAAMQLFAASITHHEILSQDGPGTRLSNASLLRYWGGSLREKIAEDFQKRGDTRGLVNYIGDQGPQAGGVLASVIQVLRDVFVGRFQNPGNLSVRQTVRERGGKCLFIEYRIRAGKALARLYRLLVDLAIKEALSTSVGNPGRIYFFLDEFRLLPRLMHLDHGLNFGREFGLRFVVGMQSHSQVKAAYGDEADSILSGFNTVIAFRTTNPETRSFIQGIAGSNQKFILMSKVPGHPYQNAFKAQVVEDHDIWNLRPGQVIVFMPGHGPFMTQLELYRPHGSP
jgi:type IV secretory pathway TraG/TraD family ATPase VirD4